jgi:glycosyltransferase involved in cell wall biosynthesis
MAKLVTVGNQYLAEYALQFNTNVKVLPSSVDIDNVHVGKHLHKDKAVINIGWTGTHTTAAKYLPQIEAVIARLSKKYSLKFIVISNQHPAINLDNLEFIAWNEKTEIEDLLKMDIGLMPIGDEEWEKGKCSFKAIQYMALGIPTVLSPYGNNTEVVEDGKNGLFAISEQEWELQISKLIEDVQLRIELGEAAIFTIKDKYALSALTSTYQMLFN